MGHRPQAQRHLAQLLLTAARHARDADELARVHLEVDALERDVPAVAERRGAPQLQHRPLALRHGDALHGERRHPPADHRLDQLGVGEVAGVLGVEDHLPTSQHGHLVGDRADLAQLVRHQHHAQALVAQLGDDAEQGLDLLRRQHARRLVEDDQPGPRHEDLEDLRTLPLTDGQVPDLRGRVDREPVRLRRLRDPCGQPREAQRRPVGERERDVLGDRQRGHQPQVLEHHADAEGPRVRRAARRDGCAVDEHAALVGRVDAVDHLEQRALAGPVLADQAVHGAGQDGEVHVPVGLHLAEPLGQAAHLEERGGLAHPAPGAGDGVGGHRDDRCVSSEVSARVSIAGQ